MLVVSRLFFARGSCSWRRSVRRPFYAPEKECGFTVYTRMYEWYVGTLVCYKHFLNHNHSNQFIFLKIFVIIDVSMSSIR